MEEARTRRGWPQGRCPATVESVGKGGLEGAIRRITATG